MNSLFLITFDNSNPFSLGPFHETILSLPNLTYWWHYISGTYLVVADSDCNKITDYISKRHPLLKFLVIKTDLENTNGVLPSDAWEWIKTNSSPLLRLLNIKVTQS